jgi:YD repeat-containing protein
MHLAASAVYQHDSAGRIMSVLEALPGGTCLTEYVYAADGRVTSMVETMGGKRRITTYNYSGNIITDMAVSEVLI